MGSANSCWSRNRVTKAFLGQLIVLYILTLKLAIYRGDIDKINYDNNLQNLQKLPDAIKNTLKLESEIQLMAKGFLNAKGSMFLEEVFLIAHEGLKIKRTFLFTC